MGLLKYEIGDKVLLKAEITSAEILKVHGKEQVMYNIRESENPVPEEMIVGKAADDKEAIEAILVRKDGIESWEGRDAKEYSVFKDPRIAKLMELGDIVANYIQENLDLNTRVIIKYDQVQIEEFRAEMKRVIKPDVVQIDL